MKEETIIWLILGGAAVYFFVNRSAAAGAATGTAQQIADTEAGAVATGGGYLNSAVNAGTEMLGEFSGTAGLF